MPRLTNLVTVEVWGFMKRFPTASTKSRKIEDVGVEFLAKIRSKLSRARQILNINWSWISTIFFFDQSEISKEFSVVSNILDVFSGKLGGNIAKYLNKCLKFMQSTSPVLDTSPGTSSSISSSYYERLETNQFEDQVLDIYKRFLLQFFVKSSYNSNFWNVSVKIPRYFGDFV